MGKNKIILVLLLLIGSGVSAQTNLDSMKAVWNDQSQTDSIRVQAFSDYINIGYLYPRNDSALILLNQLYNYSKQKGYEKGMAISSKLEGHFHRSKGNYSKAMGRYQESLAISEKIGEDSDKAKALGAIGLLYHTQSDNPRALTYYQRALKISEKIGDKRGDGAALFSIGQIYSSQGDETMALEYFEKSLNLFEKIGDKHGISLSLAEISAIHTSRGDFSTAMKYLKRSQSILEKLGDQSNIADLYRMYANISLAKDDYPNAMKQYLQGLKIMEEIDSKDGIASFLTNIGNIHIKQKDYSKAIDKCIRGLEIAEGVGDIGQQKGSCMCLFEAYKAIGNDKKALEYHEQMQLLDDSLQRDETAKMLQQMQFASQMFEDSLKQEAAKLKVQLAHETEVRKKDKNRNFLLGSGFLILLIAGGLWSRLRYIRKTKSIIEKEKDRSDSLLLNILPKMVARELKETGKAITREYDNVTILFTDFKDFTSLVASIPATTLVNELNEIFSRFDDIMDEFQVEKIETIGDAYLAACGLPVEDPDHAIKCTKAAQRMLEFLSDRNKSSNIQWTMRVGIHSGPVVAGVTGKKKFRYDLFGDTVNTASRIETNGVPGKINISQTTYNLIKDQPQFSFEPRGKIHAKGKGEIEMWFVGQNGSL